MMGRRSRRSRRRRRRRRRIVEEGDDRVWLWAPNFCVVTHSSWWRVPKPRQ